MSPSMPRRTGPEFTVEKITNDLQPLAVPIGWVRPLDKNPRRGQVEAIKRSYVRFGQRKPIVVNRTAEEDGHPTGYTEAGNHQLQAATELGWQYIAVVWEDDDDATAFAFSLADNKTHELGEYDTPLLAEFIADVAIMEGGVELLADAGFSGDELTEYINTAMSAPDPLDTEGPLDGVESGATGEGGGDMLPAPGIGLGTPVISTSIVFDTGAQQESWYRWMRHLRGEYPDMETNGERLAHYIDTYVPTDD